MSERSSVDWKKDSHKNHTIKIQWADNGPSDYKPDNSRKESILKEAEKYEDVKYIKCEWSNGKNELNAIEYSDTQKERFYNIIGNGKRELTSHAV